MRLKFLRALALLFAFSLVAAACGNDSDDDGAVSDDGSADDGSGDADGDDGSGDADGDDGSGDADGDDGSGDGDDGMASAMCDATVPGTEITMGIFSETAGLDPWISTGSGTTGMGELLALYDTLMRYDQDAKEYVPHLAESLVPNDDFSEWTLTLRDGITYPNGDALDTAMVQASMERMLGEGGRNQAKGWLAFITEYEIVDDLTMVFHLDSPWGTFPYTLADESGMIINVNVAAEMGDEEFNLNPVGGGVGPYNIERYAPGEEIVMTAKDDYWGGPVCVETLRFVRVPGAPATYEAYQNDEINVAFLREPRVIEEARANGDADNGITFLQNAGGVVMINNGVRDTTPPTTDVRLRRAIQLAIDPSVMDDRANEGTGRPTASLLDSNSLYYSDADFAPVETNTEEASRLVQEVKDEGEWDGTIRLACHNAPSRIDWAIAAEALLEAVGFEVEVDNDGTINDLIGAVIVNADFDLACWGFNVSDETPFIPLLQFRSDSGSNRIGYADPAMDEAIDQLRLASTNEEIGAALAAAWAVWQDSVPSAIYETIEEVMIWKPEVKGIIGTQASGLMFHGAYIDEG